MNRKSTSNVFRRVAILGIVLLMFGCQSTATFSEREELIIANDILKVEFQNPKLNNCRKRIEPFSITNREAINKLVEAMNKASFKGAYKGACWERIVLTSTDSVFTFSMFDHKFSKAGDCMFYEFLDEGIIENLRQYQMETPAKNDSIVKMEDVKEPLLSDGAYCYNSNTKDVTVSIHFELDSGIVTKGTEEGEALGEGIYWSSTFDGKLMGEHEMEVKVTFFPEGEQGETHKEVWQIYPDSIRILGTNRGTDGPYFFRKCQQQ